MKMPLTYHTHDHPIRNWETFISDGNGIDVARTFGETKEEAESIATMLVEAVSAATKGVKP